MTNVFDILGDYRHTIRTMQLDFMDAITSTRRMTQILISKAIDFLSNDTKNCAEVHLLYNAVQFLMAGTISHFILSHEKLTDALDLLQYHLDMTRCQTFLFYGNIVMVWTCKTMKQTTLLRIVTTLSCLLFCVGLYFCIRLFFETSMFSFSLATPFFFSFVGLFAVFAGLCVPGVCC